MSGIGGVMGENGETGVGGGANEGKTGATVSGMGTGGPGEDAELVRGRLNDHDRRRPPSPAVALPSPTLSPDDWRRSLSAPNIEAIGDVERNEPDRVELVDDRVRVRVLSAGCSDCSAMTSAGPGSAGGGASSCTGCSDTGRGLAPRCSCVSVMCRRSGGCSARCAFGLTKKLGRSERTPRAMTRTS